MKIGIVGAGAVGASCAKAMLLRGSCDEILLLDRSKKRARGVATDLSHGELLCRPTRIAAGDYAELSSAAVVIITAGVKEADGGAVDRSDKLGRLRLLPPNREIYRDIVPKIAAAAPSAVILVVTDPPDPLADIARELTGTNPVLSAGTYLDTLRFRLQIARLIGCNRRSVDALVLGEHGTSAVYAWSSARVDGRPALECATDAGLDPGSFRNDVEQAVKYANIEIIDGNGASQHGIGIVAARIVEAVLCDEGLVAPVGTWQRKFGVTLSLPSIIGAGGVSNVVEPSLSIAETAALNASAAAIANALASLD